MDQRAAAWSIARRSRDARFDGCFFVGVRTTGIYCRPVCPARMPREEHVRYFPTSAAAAEAGFRACLRCRPEVAPGSPAWIGTSATVRRACRIVDEDATDGLTVESLAARLGIGPRHLHRLFLTHLGASPQAVLATRRLHFAKQLVDGTGLPLAEIAFASGFGSIRRFNDAFRQAWGRSPSEMRRTSGAASASGRFRFRLAYRPPYDWGAMLSFLARRAVPGLEIVSQGHYRRTVAVDGTTGWIDVSNDARGGALVLEVALSSPRSLYGVVRRVRRMFDVDADPQAIADHLGADPMLGRVITRRPGIRVPGGFDPFELIVRAIVGQQISVAGATTLLSRIIQSFGGRLRSGDRNLERLFPDPQALGEAPLKHVGLTRTRAALVRKLAAAVANGEVSLAEGGIDAATFEQLLALPGIGPWTAEYVALRLCQPDAFPAGDLGLRQATGLDRRALGERAERWRPWRAYAAMYLWMENAHVTQALLHDRREPRRTTAAGARRGGAVRAAVRQRASSGGRRRGLGAER